MATPFRLKRSAIEGKRPAQADLQLGELALNTYDGYLYTEREGVGLATVTNLTPWYENYGGGSIYYSNSVGIGTTVPQYNLDVRKGSIGGYDTLVAQHSDVIKEIAVTVASKTNDHRYKDQGSGQGYVLDGIEAPILTLTPGRTYKFNLSSSDMSSHPFRFYLDEAKSVQYTTNVTTTSTSAQITITDDTPNILHYQCSSHGYMGNALIINSNVINTPYAAIIRNGLDVLSGDVDISSNLNVTGNLDVDGATTLDGTTIDGLLDINAGGQANTFKVEDLTSGRIVTVGTGGELQDSGNLLFNGTDLSASSLIVSDLTDGRVVLAGGSGAVEDNANLKFNTTTSEFEVVGHAVLDTVVASGIITASSFSGDGSNLSGIDASALKFGGAVKAQASATGVTITGNLGVSGALTYEDVTNVDSIGIVTAREGVFIPDSKELKIGNTAGSPDFTISHDTSNTILDNNTGDLILRGDGDDVKILVEDDFIVRDNDDSTNLLNCINGGAVNLYFSGTKKFETTTDGILVTGVSGNARFNQFGHLLLQNTNNGTTNFWGISPRGSGELDIGYAAMGSGGQSTTISGDVITIGTNSKVTFHSTIDVTGHAGIGSLTVAGVTTSTGGFVGNLTGNVTGTASLATDLAINGTNQLLYQDSNNDTAILPTGSAGQILQSNGAGAEPQWVTSAPAGAIEGITIRDESSIVGTANSISTINFVGSNVTADAAALAGISTIQIDHMTIQDEGSVVGTAGSISTLNFVGAGIAAVSAGSDGATITVAGGVTNADVVALAIALG